MIDYYILYVLNMAEAVVQLPGFWSQLAIAVMGITAAWYLTEPDSRSQKIGCWIGLLSEPFWLWESIRTEAFGIFILCFIYAAVYIKGIRKIK